ncbi:acyl-CoA dehydrogenase family protein [Thiomonas sp.]|uniref:acyl-CoA dehydrogenase family protein n=1 Tax=Thiomonas sp. TaxID=2047785 RepID=UPI00261703CD|nr:acyl-CoA dehydrogenase family protein [Thiomonas sp.]
MSLRAIGEQEAQEDLQQLAHRIGRESLAPHAVAVDRDARFPSEAFGALREARLLGAYVPREHGGMGLDLAQIVKLCEILGQYCSATAMVYAMHQIQVACIVHHALGSGYFAGFARRLCEHQWLLASATTEVGIGGDLRSSICSVEWQGDRFSVTKKAPVISYLDAADVLLLTARRAADSAPGDQVQIVLFKDDMELEPICGWDTLGFRGTCSSGFTVHGRGSGEQILPVPYAEIHARTMHPVAHLVWSALWIGIGIDSMNRARSVVRAQARKTPDTVPIAATRLAEADMVLQTMRAGLLQMLQEYQGLLAGAPIDAFGNFGFNIRVNNLKLNTSTLLVDLVGRAMIIGGINAYRNDSDLSLCRHLRDAYGTMVMVNNDRLLGLNAAMQIVHKDA